MLRNDLTIEKMLLNTSCRPLMALVKIMKFVREEELIANSLKILRYCIKDESVSDLLSSYPIIRTTRKP